MKNWQADCEDGWKSSKVKAEDIDKAADMLSEELMMHVKDTHQMVLPKDPKKMHREVREYTHMVV
jgi:hypothetical protein